jgi:hypothetical protein
VQVKLKEKFFLFSFLCTTLLHLPPLRFHGVGGCWDRTQHCCGLGLDSQNSNHSARFHPGMQVDYARESLERSRGRERVERGDEKKDEEEKYSYFEEWKVEKKRLKR